MENIRRKEKRMPCKLSKGAVCNCFPRLLGKNEKFFLWFIITGGEKKNVNVSATTKHPTDLGHSY